MIKYIVQTLKGVTSVIEVEVIPVTLLQDPSLAWRLKSGEELYKFIRPKSLEGEQHYSFFFEETEDSAKTMAGLSIVEDMDRSAYKLGTSIDETLCKEKLANIKVVKL